jgi:hypothetical protein
LRYSYLYLDPRVFAQNLRIAVTEAHEKRGTKLRALAAKLVEEGLAGNVYALKEIADRLDGKAIQQHQVDMEERIKLIAVVPQKAARWIGRCADMRDETILSGRAG